MSGIVEYEVLQAVTPVDRAVFADAWSLPDDPGLRFGLVRDAVEWHMKACPQYARFAARSGFSPDQLRSPADLHRVPQIPTLAFKRGEAVMSCAWEEVAKRCTSSGTLGRRSEVYRDRGTIERLLGSVRWGVELIGDWEDDDVALVNLGPGQREAGDLWFAYVMSLVEMLYPTIHAVQDGKFDPRQALESVDLLRRQYPIVIVIGPPALMLEVAEAAAATQPDRPVSSQLFAVTAGGWKRGSGAVMDREEFTAALMDGLRLADRRQIRDAFNQVELNTVLLECDAQRKHVTPWLEVIVRDPRTLQPVAPGEPGLISYLDPSATSYPCFIIGDDVGTVNEGPCPCGWHGRTLELHRRVKRDEEWGCALKMDRDYSSR